jgi:Sulfatase-modifying factor enzyme 1
MEKIIQDRTGFPMIWVEPLAAHLGWLPVTKIQFEKFLCDTADGRFGPRWYDEVLSLNPRVSPGSITPSNYWRSFITGVLPSEADCFARWMGEEYHLPTLAEWDTAYQHLRRPGPTVPDWRRELQSPDARCLALLAGVEAAAGGNGSERHRAERMLLRGGVMEWVELAGREPRWGGMGDVAGGLAGLLFDADAGRPHQPFHPESERIAFYGFRLLRKETR